MRLVGAGMAVSQHLEVTALSLHSLYTAGELAHLADLPCIHGAARQPARRWRQVCFGDTGLLWSPALNV